MYLIATTSTPPQYVRRVNYWMTCVESWTHDKSLAWLFHDRELATLISNGVGEVQEVERLKVSA